MPEDKKQNEIIRIQKKRNNFVMLDKGFLEDDRLSYKAKGILAYLLSKPDGWKVIVKDLTNHAKDGKKAVYSGLRELKEHGYYKKVPVRDETGRRIDHWESVVFECPEENPEKPKNPDQNQKPENPKSQDENPVLTQKEKTDENCIKSTPYLLTPFVYIEDVKIQNRQHNNNYKSNNELNNISYPIESNRFCFGTTQANDADIKTDRIGFDGTITQLANFEQKNKPLAQSAGAEQNKEGFQNATVTSDNAFTKPSTTKHSVADIEEIIKSNIYYDYILAENRYHKDRLDGVVRIIVSTIVTDFDGGYISMGNEKVPAELVRSVFFKLTKDDIDYFLQNFDRQTDPTIKLMPYIRTALYRNHGTTEFYWRNRANVDIHNERLDR